MIGGVSYPTRFHSIDYDSAGNLVIGGESEAPALLGTSIDLLAPFIINIQRGNLYRWGVRIGDASNYDRVSAIKYNPSFDKVFGALDSISSTQKKNPAFVVLKAKDGTVLKTLKINNQLMLQIRKGGVLLVDYADKLHFGFTI